MPGGANLNLKLASTMVRAITLLLDQLRQQAGWGEAVLAMQSGEAGLGIFADRTVHKSAMH